MENTLVPTFLGVPPEMTLLSLYPSSCVHFIYDTRLRCNSNIWEKGENVYLPRDLDHAPMARNRQAEVDSQDGHVQPAEAKRDVQSLDLPRPKASLALSDPRTPAELATLRQKMLRLEEALRLDPYEAGTRAQRDWDRFVAAWEAALGALIANGRAEILP
jgi:hypothetical protein